MSTIAHPVLVTSDGFEFYDKAVRHRRCRRASRTVRCRSVTSSVPALFRVGLPSLFLSRRGYWSRFLPGLSCCGRDLQGDQLCHIVLRVLQLPKGGTKTAMGFPRLRMGCGPLPIPRLRASQGSPRGFCGRSGGMKMKASRTGAMIATRAVTAVPGLGAAASARNVDRTVAPRGHSFPVKRALGLAAFAVLSLAPGSHARAHANVRLPSAAVGPNPSSVSLGIPWVPPAA